MVPFVPSPSVHIPFLDDQILSVVPHEPIQYSTVHAVCLLWVEPNYYGHPSDRTQRSHQGQPAHRNHQPLRTDVPYLESGGPPLQRGFSRHFVSSSVSLWLGPLSLHGKEAQLPPTPLRDITRGPIVPPGEVANPQSWRPFPPTATGPRPPTATLRPAPITEDGRPPLTLPANSDWTIADLPRASSLGLSPITATTTPTASRPSRVRVLPLLSFCPVPRP